MLLVLFILLTLVGIGVYFIGDKKFYYLCLDVIGGFIAGFSAFCFAMSLLIILLNNVGINARVEKYKETYNAITYKVESGACSDELGLLSKDVLNEVQDWNSDIVYYKNIQNDFWVGVFIPNIYDQFKTIDYENYETNNLK